MLITEELTDKQKKRVDSWKKTTSAVDISKHVIPPGQDRIILPLDHGLSNKIDAPDDIKTHLDKHGYSIHNYADGLAADKYGRHIKIGKALKQTGADNLLTKYNTDPNRNGIHFLHNVHIIVSRHPYDVAGMSTNKGWTSCMDMDCGSETKYLHRDIKHGTHTAYLVHAHDENIRMPMARINLKPFTSHDGTHTILRPEKLYGTASSLFDHTINKWVYNNFPLHDDKIYSSHPSLYNDSNPVTISKSLSNDFVKDIISNASKVLPSFHHKLSHPANITEDHLSHIAEHGTDEQRQMVLDHFTKHHLDKSIPYLSASALIEHGNDSHRTQIINNHINRNERYIGDLAVHGNDSHRVALLNRLRHIPNELNHFDAHDLVDNMKDESNLKDFVDHPSTPVRKRINQRLHGKYE